MADADARVFELRVVTRQVLALRQTERLDTWAQSPGALLRKSLGGRFAQPLAKLRRDPSHPASEEEGVPGDQRQLRLS